jgi:hypothetical protein
VKDGAQEEDLHASDVGASIGPPQPSEGDIAPADAGYEVLVAGYQDTEASAEAEG